MRTLLKRPQPNSSKEGRRSPAPPVKVVYLLDSYVGPTAGTEAQLFELLKGLDRTRFEPALAVLRPTTFIETHDLPCPVTVLGVRRLRSPVSWWKLLRFAGVLRRSGVGLVHILFNDASIVGPLFCRLAGARTVVARRDVGIWYTPATLRLVRYSNWFVDAIVTNSEAVKDSVTRCERFPLARTLVLKNGHDPARFLAGPDPHLKRRLGIAMSDPLVGMVANFRPIKRHEDLLKAFAVVLQRHPRAHLLLLGNGDGVETARGVADRLGITTQVHFLGSEPDAVPIVKHFDVCVLSSSSEGLSNAIVEYLGCGRPVVCTKAGGNVELVIDGRNGFLVEVGDASAMADRIGRLLDDPTLAEAMGQRGREMFISSFTSDRMLSAYMDLYDRLLLRPARSQGCD
jgi:L-malate glycosyltransferase